MTCEIETKHQRLDGPAGPVTIRSHCKAHGFVLHGEAMASFCPIGQIEEATEKAMAQILAMAGQRDPATENVGYDTAPTDPHHGGKIVEPAPKRPRKPKPTEE